MYPRSFVFVAAALAVGTLTLPANAQEIPAPASADEAPRQRPTTTPPARDEPMPAPPPAARGRWYGWQTLIADGVGALLAVGLGSKDQYAAALAAGGGIYALGGPIVHVANGEPLRALGSFGMRALGPAVALGGAAAIPNGSGGLEAVPYAVGASLMITAVVLDAAILARKSSDNAATVSPRVSVAPGAASVGVGGVF